MGKPKKKAPEMTTEQTLKRLFGKKGTALLKRLVQKLDNEKASKKRMKKRDD
jgi:hypothetical protein